MFLKVGGFILIWATELDIFRHSIMWEKLQLIGSLVKGVVLLLVGDHLKLMRWQLRRVGQRENWLFYFLSYVGPSWKALLCPIGWIS